MDGVQRLGGRSVGVFSHSPPPTHTHTHTYTHTIHTHYAYTLRTPDTHTVYIHTMHTHYTHTHTWDRVRRLAGR